MKIRGSLSGVSRDWKSGKYQITIEMQEGNIEEIEPLKEKELAVEIKKFSQRRSLNANRLLWECLGQIATFKHEAKWDTYLHYLKQAGQFTYVCVKPNAVEAVKRQWRETEEIGEIDINGQKAVQLICYFGSSTYTSAEFKKILDYIIEDMKEIGLETPTTEEMQRTIQQLEKEQNKERIKEQQEKEIEEKVRAERQKKAEEASKKRKVLWSIFTSDMDTCIITGSNKVERHHVFSNMGGGMRELSEKYGFIAPLAPHLHPNGVHATEEALQLDEKLKRSCQGYYERHYGSREDFIREFGKNYLI